MILGDLNLHLDKTDLLETVKFNTLLSIHGLMQKVDFSTHCSGHILDVMIVREHDSSFFSSRVCRSMFIRSQSFVV